MKKRIEALRRQQDAINSEISGLLLKRLNLSKRILSLKKLNELPLMDPAREEEIVHQLICNSALSDSEKLYLTNCFLQLCQEARKAFRRDEM